MGAQAADKTPPPLAASQTTPSVPDPRDERIKQLETALAQERQALAELRDAFDAARFKAEILEKSYAKQLADAREKTASLEGSLADERSKLAVATAELAAATDELKDARAEIEHLCTSKGLQRHPAVKARAGKPRQDADYIVTGGTINALISTEGWETDGTGSRPSRRALDQVATPQESSGEDMLAPDLVFTKKDRDKDD